MNDRIFKPEDFRPLLDLIDFVIKICSDKNGFYNTKLLYQMFHPDAETKYTWTIRDKTLNNEIVRHLKRSDFSQYKFSQFTQCVVLAAHRALILDPLLDKDEIISMLMFWIEDREKLKEKLQNELNEQFAEDDDQNPLGKYAFSNIRKQGYETPKEYDTKLEFKLCKHIENHFQIGLSFSSSTTDFFKSMLKKNMYDDIIKQPSQKNLYRGMAVTDDWLDIVSKNSTIELNTIKKDFVFKPLSDNGSTSWTTDYDIACDFARNEVSTSKPVMIVMIAQLSDNENCFLSCQDGFYKLLYSERFEKEKECIGLGDIKVFEIDVID